jgi:hydroxymethylpyrimidine/phosphomethylpyrimidine kinase
MGMALPAAVAMAQAYTWTSLALGWRTGRCQRTPNRLFDLPGAGARPAGQSGATR